MPKVCQSGAGGGLPGRHLAGLGAAVDLDQRRVERGLGARGELRRQRRGRADGQVDRRQRDAGVEQQLQVERRRHQHARPRHAGQRGGDVGRIERALDLERGAADQRDQHGRLEAVHVLRRHGADDRRAGQVAQAHRLGQPVGLGLRARDQQRPRLRVRHRRAGRARGQDLGDDALGVDLRQRRGRVERGMRGQVIDRRQPARRRARIGERVERRGTGAAAARSCRACGSAAAG